MVLCGRAMCDEIRTVLALSLRGFTFLLPCMTDDLWLDAHIVHFTSLGAGYFSIALNILHPCFGTQLSYLKMD